MFSMLHIDNSAFYKEILRGLAVEKDFQYFSAKTPQRAYEILKTHPIDIIITGLEFKGVSEEEWIRSLMEVKPCAAPVIVLTAVENAALRTRLLKLGISDFLTKDHFPEYLGLLVQKLKAVDANEAKLRSFRIAVLDDDESHLRIMKDIFEGNGITHVDFYLHPGALLSSQKAYTIYLVDCVLPDIYGEQVIREIRIRDEYAVIIAVSSLNSHAVISSILMAGADDFITKPFSENLLMARLKANIRTYTLMEQLKEKNMRLSQMIKEDSLTGLYNHRFIMEYLETEIERAHRHQKPLSVLMFDIDRFKAVNDTCGHYVGDIVLSEIGRLLWNDSRRIDIAGRYGGEEFIVILPDTDQQGAIIYAERLRQEIEAMRFSEENLSITISGGISVYTGETPIELVKKADKHLYRAKRNGRNCIEFERQPTA